MPVPALNHRQIVGVVKCAGEGFKPLDHLRSVDASDAQAFGAAPQFAVVPGGDNDAARHHPYLNRHPVSKSRVQYPLAA